MSEDAHAEGESVEHEQPARISAACETLANVRTNAADSLAYPHLSNETGIDHTTTSTVASATSENTQQNTRLPISSRDLCLTPSVEPDGAPFHGNQKILLTNKNIATQNGYATLRNSHSVQGMAHTEEALLKNVTENITLDSNLTKAEDSRNITDDTNSEVETSANSWKSPNTEATDHLHGIVLDGVNEMQSQILRAVNTVNTTKEIAVMDIHREKEDALHSYRNETALETSAAVKEIEITKIHALNEIAALGKKVVNARLTGSTLESRYAMTGTGSAKTQEIRDVLILHSDKDRDLANTLMDIIVNQCALPLTIDIYAKFAIGESKMNVIDDIFIKYRWVLFLVSHDYELNGFHNFQGGAVLMKELEENGNTRGRFVPLLTEGIKRKNIRRAWLKSIQPICFPDDTFIETIVKLVERFR